MSVPFLAQLHQHVLTDLDRSARADTVFVFGAVVLDIVSLAVNSTLAASNNGMVVLVWLLLLFGVFVVSSVAIGALMNGVKGCRAYHDALLAMYEKEGIAGYYPQEGARSGLARYRLSFVLVIVLGFLAIAVPLIIKAMSRG